MITIECPKCKNIYDGTKTYFQATRLNSVLRNKRKVCICLKCLEDKPSNKKCLEDKSSNKSKSLKSKKLKTSDFLLSDGNVIQMPDHRFHSTNVYRHLNSFDKDYKDRGFIYVIGPEDGPFKIGITKDVKTRLRELQVGCWFKIKVHFILESIDPRHTEEIVHSFLSQYRLNGEWFKCPLNGIIHTIEMIYEKMLVISRKDFLSCVYD
ncbi:GIY-YIG nuclease family protein [bacterium]|nr:GIY-YIG nuclease family protein [bacterium]